MRVGVGMCTLGLQNQGKGHMGQSCLSGAFGGRLTKCLTNVPQMVAERGQFRAAGVKEVHLRTGKLAADQDGPHDCSPLCPRGTGGVGGSQPLNGKFVNFLYKFVNFPKEEKIFFFSSFLQEEWRAGPLRQGRAGPGASVEPARAGSHSWLFRVVE